MVVERKPKLDPIVKVNGKTVDLRPVLPMTMGDQKTLHKTGLNLRKSADWEPAEQANFVLYFLRKAEAGITEDDVDTLTVGQVMQVLAMINATSEEDTKPYVGFLERPTSSPVPTGGPETTLSG